MNHRENTKGERGTASILRKSETLLCGIFSLCLLKAKCISVVFITIHKVKITNDLRRYNAPARGSQAWGTLFKKRTSVERVNAYLKEFFQLNNVRYRTGKRAKLYFDMVTLVFHASKLAADRINAQLRKVKFSYRSTF